MQLETAESTRVDLKALCSAAPPCLTISMPVFVSPDQARQNPVRLRQVIQQAKEQLEQYGVDPRTAETMLAEINLSADHPEGHRGVLFFRNASDVALHT